MRRREREHEEEAEHESEFDSPSVWAEGEKWDAPR